MNDKELEPLPKGLPKTVAYTQLCEAIKKDFGIELPMESGEETARAVEEMLGIRTPDPMLEALAGALEEIARCLSHGLQDCRASIIAKDMLGKYQQSKVQP